MRTCLFCSRHPSNDDVFASEKNFGCYLSAERRRGTLLSKDVVRTRYQSSCLLCDDDSGADVPRVTTHFPADTHNQNHEIINQGWKQTSIDLDFLAQRKRN